MWPLFAGDTTAVRARDKATARYGVLECCLSADVYVAAPGVTTHLSQSVKQRSVSLRAQLLEGGQTPSMSSCDPCVGTTYEQSSGWPLVAQTCACSLKDACRQDVQRVPLLCT